MWNDYSTSDRIRVYLLWDNLCDLVDTKNNRIAKNEKRW